MKLTRANGGITCEMAEPPLSASGSLAPFGVVGLSHKSAPLDLRSTLGFTKEQIPELLDRARKAGLHECIILATCNRTELYFSGGSGLAAAELLADYAGMPVEVLREYLYERSCVCAACHLFRVTAGLDSALLGETEIVAQVKEAWSIADSHGMVGPMLDLLFKRAMEASKRIRTETDLCKSVVSTATLAVREAEAKAGMLDDKTVLLLGAGKIAERVAKEVAGKRTAKSLVVNRTREHAEKVAELMNAEARDFNELAVTLAKADVTFAAVGAGHAVIDTPLIDEVMALRANRPLVIVDLGVPPNVKVTNMPAGVTVIGLSELNSKSAVNNDTRHASVQPSLSILDQEIGRFGEALIERSASPTIKALMGLGESVRQRNLEWAKERLPDLDERHLRVIDELTRRTIIGLLESPIHNLKTDAAWNERRHLVERLFAIDGGE
ncbi:MAG: glutamyl-tRNA reductase [Armatimonadetes bacterium]|nr:glutamyl-tRNA reductase [Armatimonadota bacterium]